MSRAFRAVLFILLARVAGNDFLLQSYLMLDCDGVAPHQPLTAPPITSADNDGDDHNHPLPAGPDHGVAFLVLLALVLPQPAADATVGRRDDVRRVTATPVRAAQPRGPPRITAWA